MGGQRSGDSLGFGLMGRTGQPQWVWNVRLRCNDTDDNRTFARTERCHKCPVDYAAINLRAIRERTAESRNEIAGLSQS